MELKKFFWTHITSSIDNMANFLDVINKEQMASFLHDDAIRIIVVVCTTHTI
jgi:hypothetical protein